MVKKLNIIKALLCILLTSPLLAPPAAWSQVLWDNWYTVTKDGHPDSYYNEKAELLTGRAKIQVNWWISEKDEKLGDRIRTENLGATAKNTAQLEPILYNYRTTQADGTEKVIDGTILKDGKVFSVKIKKGNHVSAPLKAEMLPKLMLASFFPVWINKNYKRISPVQPIEFSAIVEDQVEKDVPIIKGSAYEMVPDDFAKQTKTRKLRIEFSYVVAYWYVTPKGDAVKISIPSQNREVLKVDKDKAKAFLPEPKSSS